ncbi:hypothetical protein [Melissospora conviva]|uniref:hypothetical protein n=1 Tax=Melissospora conviva TaxID=3388432 RepID=UPI003B7BA1E3
MSSSTWDDINGAPEPVLLDAAKCCVPASATGSPIDDFYETTAHILTLGDPDSLRSSPTLGRLLILGLVTGTEAYFRAILLGVMTTCPLIRESIADQQIPFGSVEFYGVKNMALGLLEGVSFASGAEIKKRTRSLTGITWADNTSLGVAVETFDRVCHMRHAAVHAQGVLNRGNARALGLATTAGPLHVVIDMANLHLAAKACNSMVRAYNLFLYKSILQRWMASSLLTGTWQKDKKHFGGLFDLFCSRTDGIAPSTPYAAYRAFRPSIVRRLAS